VTARDAADLKWSSSRAVPLRDLLERFVVMLERLTPEQLGRVLSAAERSLSATLGGHAALASLTRREREVFNMIARGATSEHVAQTLQITLKTVQTHRSKINIKLDVHTPGQLVAFASREGLL